MYLFTKRTRNVIKIIWGVLATLVIISMIITYSGFISLTATQSNPQNTAQDTQPTTPATSVDLNDISGQDDGANVAQGTETDTATGTVDTPTPPVELQIPTLKLEI